MSTTKQNKVPNKLLATEIIALQIPPELAGQRLDKALTSLLQATGEGWSRARLQALLAAGLVQDAKGVIKDASVPVLLYATYSVTVPPPVAATPVARAMALNIVYEDADLLVIDKPAGLVVHPAAGHRDDTLVNALLAHCGDSLSGIGGVARPGIVHRLDKDTSGLMVVAKNDAAHQALTAQFAAAADGSGKSLQRVYWALAWGWPQPPEGIIEAPIGRNPRDRQKMAVSLKGRAAITEYKVRDYYRNERGEPLAAAVECRLQTGRTHQIRVHMAHLGFPLVGDPLYAGRYGRRRILSLPRQALHAAELSFIHPKSRKKMRFKSALPADLLSLIKGLDK